jgi:uncharacterized protein (DUF2236 family)
MAALFPDGEEAANLLTGPDSVAWRFGSDARLYLVMLYPLLLQVAHPTVGAGVNDFSDFEHRPWERLLRTLDWVSLLIYGGHDAVAAGRRLRAIHKGFRGTREDGASYYALEPDAYAWVHATLIESYLAGHAHFGRPMTPAEAERFYLEYRGLGRLVGVREHDLPEDLAGFRSYFDQMTRTELTHTTSVQRVLQSVRAAPRPPALPLPGAVWRTIRFPAGRALWIGGIGLLPPHLRDRFGITWTRSDERIFRSAGRTTRGLTPLMPRRLQVMGPDQLRLRRRAISRGPLGGDAPSPRTPTRAAAA